MGRKKNPDHYVDKNEMLEELRDYKRTGEISEELGSMFSKIARHYASLPKFSGYSYIEDMISSAVERMVTQVDRFDPERPDANPFAYFTLTTHRQFLAVLKKEKRQTEIRRKYRTNVWDNLYEEENIQQVKDANDTEEE
jgi:DNA-directed RNA polymerase specialized sigma24 family protein